MSKSYVIGFTVLSQIMNFTFLRNWCRFSDRFSNKPVVGLCGSLFMACFLAFAFTTMSERYIMTIPLIVVIHVFMGISTARVRLASGNIRLKLSPKGQVTSYLAANSIVNSFAAGITPVIGGKLADFFATRQLSLILRWTSPGHELAFETFNFQHWELFFLFAFLIGLYSIHRLTRLEEAGEVEGRIVLHELISEVRSEIRNLSTANGIREMVKFPFAPVRTGLRDIAKRKRSRKRSS